MKIKIIESERLVLKKPVYFSLLELKGGAGCVTNRFI